MDLRHVAEWAGTTVDEIQALNPELRRWTTPVKYPEYEVKVPKGTADQLSAKLADASPADFTALKWYTAKKGETLLTVARRFGVSRSDVAEANNLTVKARLRPGQELIIPRAPATLLAARTERTAPSAVASRAIAEPAESRRASARRRQRRRRFDLQGQARRHALLDRAALRHDRRQDQELEPSHDQSLASAKQLRISLRAEGLQLRFAVCSLVCGLRVGSDSRFSQFASLSTCCAERLDHLRAARRRQPSSAPPPLSRP